MGDDTVVVQIILQVCNPREAFAFHDNERTDHGFFGEASPPSCHPGQREVQSCKQLVIKCSGTLGCKQCYILNDFLSVDSGQPFLVGFLSSQFYQKRLRFPHYMSDFQLQPWPESLAIIMFFEFCSWLA